MERGRLACQTILSLKLLGENVIYNVELIDNFTREKAIDIKSNLLSTNTQHGGK